MCQGAVISLVKFKKGKRIVRIPVHGIGSHSELIEANTKLLKRKGWRDNLPGQEVISIESDFSAWNKFTVESGAPDKSDMGILRREYKKIAGSASALIKHVKRCGKIDDALLRLLTAPALEQYNKVKAPALEQYNKVKAPAWEQYNKVEAQAWEQYNKVKAPAWCKLFAKKENRVEHLR